MGQATAPPLPRSNRLQQGAQGDVNHRRLLKEIIMRYQMSALLALGVALLAGCGGGGGGGASVTSTTQRLNLASPSSYVITDLGASTYYYGYYYYPNYGLYRSPGGIAIN